jgi:hypothetical protein
MGVFGRISTVLFFPKRKYLFDLRPPERPESGGTCAKTLSRASPRWFPQISSDFHDNLDCVLLSRLPFWTSSVCATRRSSSIYFVRYGARYCGVGKLLFSTSGACFIAVTIKIQSSIT